MYVPLGSELQEVFEMLTMPLQRAFVLIMSLEIGGVSLGGLLIVGVVIAVLIEVLMHMKGPGISDLHFRKDKN